MVWNPHSISSIRSNCLIDRERQLGYTSIMVEASGADTRPNREPQPTVPLQEAVNRFGALALQVPQDHPFKSFYDGSISADVKRLSRVVEDIDSVRDLGHGNIVDGVFPTGEGSVQPASLLGFQTIRFEPSIANGEEGSLGTARNYIVDQYARALGVALPQNPQTQQPYESINDVLKAMDDAVWEKREGFVAQGLVLNTNLPGVKLAIQRVVSPPNMRMNGKDKDGRSIYGADIWLTMTDEALKPPPISSDASAA